MQNPRTTIVRGFLGGGFLLALISFASGCVVEPREGYWDHDHNRYYHEHAWVACDHEHCH